MSRIKINIAILESSSIIFEGIVSLLSKADSNLNYYHCNSLETLKNYCIKRKIDIAIINPLLLINIQNDFIKFKREHNDIYFLGIVYSFLDKATSDFFDEIIHITDKADVVIAKLHNAKVSKKKSINIREELTARETDVLIQLLKGLSNKEIAEELNISIHTVISHRKNIAEKTGIKSLPGLTIYAISKKIIPQGY